MREENKREVRVNAEAISLPFSSPSSLAPSFLDCLDVHVHFPDAEEVIAADVQLDAGPYHRPSGLSPSASPSEHRKPASSNFLPPACSVLQPQREISFPTA
ncbi:hypothetical protein NQZ68_002898 [Dissostichus eleginoides]|nr:hypothetical protein NQZ68_002898 [Dissostichus eleginoides]